MGEDAAFMSSRARIGPHHADMIEVRLPSELAARSANLYQIAVRTCLDHLFVPRLCTFAARSAQFHLVDVDYQYGLYYVGLFAFANPTLYTLELSTLLLPVKCL